MAFRKLDIDTHCLKFNSAVSSDFIELYNAATDEEIIEGKGLPHKTFAPSSFRCDRISWFRLRGVAPDKITTPDRTLDFTAQVGSALHELIQRRLMKKLSEDWISVEDHLKEIQPEYSYRTTCKGPGFETFIEIDSPPVRFACDGIVRMNGTKYLLEIKSSEYNSFLDLKAPKPQHVDQVRCYASLLNIQNALVLYIDRMYGSLKCFELKIQGYEIEEIRTRMKRVEELAETCIAPEALPAGDPWCTPSMCQYYKTCKEWGR